MAQCFGEDWGELDVPLPQSLVDDVHAALVEEFLNVRLAEWEALVEPRGVADDAQGETVAVRLAVRHSPLALSCQNPSRHGGHPRSGHPMDEGVRGRVGHGQPCWH